MANEMVVREKALSLRDFLSNKDRIKSFEAVLPAWLSVDRFLKVVFSSALRNPKILDCTKESILNAVMGCATLGLEPILGRAYLIPYNNNKQINGRWQKVLECQFQPGYQGLIDLARRSNTISDVRAYNVYQNDEFDLSFGMTPDIHHRPWYMVPEKAGEGPGDIFGAYCVWILKDGTKHPEFMHIMDIHKRRDRSQAYQNDMKYKTTNSPWLQWPEDMNLKTVIKHSSKMVPASIEFMQAVSYDNDAQMGRVAFDGFLSGGMGTAGPHDNEEALDKILTEKGIEKERADKFFELLVGKYGSPKEDIVSSAIDDPESFFVEYKKWEAVAYKKALKDTIGQLKTTGLTAWERKNHNEIEALSEEDKGFFIDKWRRTIKADYYAEGQPGYKAPQSQAGGEGGGETTEDKKEDSREDAKGQGQQPPPENDRSAKLKVEFRKAMLIYRDNEDEGIGSAKFYQVLRSAGFQEIEDVPENEFNNILQAMEDARYTA